MLGELEAVNRQDPDGLAGHFSEDCQFVDLSDGTVIEGKEAFLADLVGVFSSVPDLHVVEKRLVAEDGVAAAEILLAGTHVNEWRGHPPTGVEFTWHTCSVYDLDDEGEHLKRERMYYDASRLDRILAGGGG